VPGGRPGGLHDILLAVGARRIGARIITDNERDFSVIARLLPTERMRSEALLLPTLS
jgi:predicted nucleic acid-binding protein